MSRHVLVALATALLIPTSVATFGECPPNTEINYYSESCATSTDVTIALGNCTASGEKQEDAETIPCSAFSRNPFQTNCHECNAGGSTVVCSESTDSKAVCKSLANRECQVDMGYFAQTFPCRADDRSQYDMFRWTCSGDDDRRFVSEIRVTLDCRANGDLPYCYNCDGFEMCAAVDGSTCKSIMAGGSTSSAGNGS